LDRERIYNLVTLFIKSIRQTSVSKLILKYFQKQFGRF
jgi:hypothetical protein